MTISPDKSHLALSHINHSDPYPIITIYNAVIKEFVFSKNDNFLYSSDMEG